MQGTRTKTHITEEASLIAVYGERVGVAKVEVLGSPTGATGGKWTQLLQTNVGLYEWYIGFIGSPFQVRFPQP